MTDPDLDPTSDRISAPAVTFSLRPIGLVHAAAHKGARIPKYFVSKGRTTIEVFHPYLSGLKGLYGGSELWVITYHAPAGQSSLRSWQSGDGLHGVFATTSVERPNPIEFLRARVVDLDPDRGLLHLEGLNVKDGAPVLDIRPATTPHHRLDMPSE